jgi:DNA-binding transcriptional ArsR family regulator
MTALTAAQQSLRSRCLRLNTREFRVFPVGAEKRPLITGYHGDGPFKVSEIHSWRWSLAEGLGWALPSDVVLLDVDVKGGQNGLEHLARLESELGRLPATASQETLSGGRHLFFRWPDMPERLPNRVPFLDGLTADIDLCHRKHRYACIYDADLFGEDLSKLPDPWKEHLGTRSKPKPRSLGDSVVLTNGGVQALLLQVSDAQEGTRNVTLYEATTQLALTNRWTDFLDVSLIQAALNAGLAEHEIRRTINSARTAAHKRRDIPDQWLEEVQTDPRLRRMLNIGGFATVNTIHRLVIDHGEPFALSCRELAEKAGRTYPTASRHLKKLMNEGYLTRTSKGRGKKAAEWALRTPDRSMCNTPPPTSSTSTGTGRQEDGGVLHIDQNLLGHDAFNRMRGRQTFPKSGLRVLIAVQEGHDTIAAISRRTNLSTASVRRNRLILESAGLLSCDKVDGRWVFKANFKDLKDALDKWAHWSGAEGIGDLRRTQHALERKIYGENFTDKGKRRRTSKLPAKRRAPITGKEPTRPMKFGGRKKDMDGLR